MMAFHDVPSQLICTEPLVYTQTPTISVAQSSPEEGFENKRISIEGEKSINDGSGKRCSIKHKSEKRNYKQLANSIIYDFVSPKSAFMVFNEVFQDVKIVLQKHPENLLNCESYSASFEIDGQFYAANDISMDVAREKACERYLRHFFARKICEISEEKKSIMEIKMEEGKYGTLPISGSSLNDFLWKQYAKLAMHILLNQWEIVNYSKAFNVLEKFYNRAVMKKFPKDPGNIHPIQLFNRMRPDVEYTITMPYSKFPPIYQVDCMIDEIHFVEQGSSKKAAMKKCCIKAIKHLWNFDFDITN